MRNKLVLAAIVAAITIPTSYYMIYMVPGFNDLLITDFYSYGISILTACAYAFIIGVIARIAFNRIKGETKIPEQ